jgi:hypothetical protein
MKPYKKGMTEAITGGGQEVTQIVEFDEIAIWKICGVFNNKIGIFRYENLFAKVEYRWQWLLIHTSSGRCHASNYYTTEDDVKEAYQAEGYTIHERIEVSKKEVI